MTRRLSMAVWGQALYSASNLVFAVVLARSLSAAGFGRVTASLALLSIPLMLARHLVNEPLLVGYSGVGRRTGSNRLGSPVLIVLAVGVVTMVAEPLLLGAEGLAVAVLTPLVLFQDHIRYRAFRAGRGQSAIAGDAVAVVAMLPAFLVPLDLWGVTGWFASSLVVSLVLMRHDVVGALRRLVDRVAVGHAGGLPAIPVRALTVEFALVDSTSALLVAALASFGSAEEVAELRVTLIPYGALWVIVSGIRSLGLAMLESGPVPARVAAARRYGLMAMAVAFAIGLSTVVVPDAWWSAVLGQPWAQGWVLLLCAAALHMLRGVAAGEMLVLRSERWSPQVARVRSLSAVVALPLSIAAVVAADATVFLLTVLFGELVMVVLLRRLTGRLLRSPATAGSGTD